MEPSTSKGEIPDESLRLALIYFQNCLRLMGYTTEAKIDELLEAPNAFDFI